MAISCTVGGQPVLVMRDITTSRKLGLRGTASFVIKELTPTFTLTQNMKVLITDSTYGTLFSGYVDTFSLTKIPGGGTMLFKHLTCKDSRYVADKRYVTAPDFVYPRLAGDLACDLHQHILAGEGVTAQYAMRRDHDAATWGDASATLSNTQALASGLLALADAGSLWSQVEDSTADFDAGTISGTDGVSGELRPLAWAAIKMVGSAAPDLGQNCYHYHKVWTGSSYTIVSGDQLEYDVWVASTSPQIKGAVDLTFSDGTHLRDTGSPDQHHFDAHPGTDLSGWADDQWYHREIPLDTYCSGQAVTQAQVAFEGDAPGTYTCYVKNIKITNGVTTKKTFYSSGALVANAQASNRFYYNVSITTTTTYQNGSRVSPAYSCAGAGIAATSLITWLATEAAQPAGSRASQTSSSPQVLVETSLDGGKTWQVATNHQAIPGVLPGMNLSGHSVTLRETLSLVGSSPEVFPSLQVVTLTILPAAATSKSDAADADATSGELAAGTLSNTAYDADLGGLTLSGDQPGVGWTPGGWPPPNLTLYGSGGDPACFGYKGGFALNCNSGNFTMVKMTDVTARANFIAEFDIEFRNDPTVGVNEMAFVFRTTYWGNADDTFGGRVFFEPNTGITLGHGSNSSSGSWTQDYRYSMTFDINTTYSIRFKASGSTYTCWVNDVQMFSVTNGGPPTGSGGFGFHYYQTMADGHKWAIFSNCGVMPTDTYSGTRTASAVSLSTLGSVQDSRIWWGSYAIGSSSGLLVEASTDGGSTYSACTNGGVIPGLEPGTSVVTKSLLVRCTFTTGNPNSVTVLQGISWLVVGAYSASGTRVSGALDLSGVGGELGSSSATWDAVVPANTTVKVETAPTTSGTWTQISTPGDPIAALASQSRPTPVLDSYAGSSAADYSATYYGSNSPPTATFDTANSRLSLAGGQGALYVWNKAGTAFQNGEAWAIVSAAAQTALLLRYASTGNFYSCVFSDTSAGTNPGQAWCVRRQSGTNSTIAGPITLPGAAFARGTVHRARAVIVGSLISFYWDGTLVYSVTDTAFSASGATGLRQNEAGPAVIELLASQPYGASMAGISAYSRITLTTTDPTTGPLVAELALTARSPALTSGALVPSTKYQWKKVSAILDDLANQSGGWWGLDDTLALFFADRTSQYAPWPLASANCAGNPDHLQMDATPTVSYMSHKYRNTQYVNGGVAQTHIVDSFVGNVYAQSFSLSYNAGSVNSVTLNGLPQTFGLRGTDSGKQWYYEQGSPVLSQDTAATPLLASDLLVVDYQGLTPANSVASDGAAIAALSAVDDTSGIVEDVEDNPDLDQGAADARAAALRDAYSVFFRNFSFTTRQAGLAPGHLLPVLVPELGIGNDAFFLIVQVDATITEEAGATKVIYDVSATEGPADPVFWVAYFAEGNNTS